jgi:hypothetical protein
MIFIPVLRTASPIPLPKLVPISEESFPVRIIPCVHPHGTLHFCKGKAVEAPATLGGGFSLFKFNEGASLA